MNMDYRQWIGVSGVLAGLIVVVRNYIEGDIVSASILLVVLGVLLGALLWWTRPSGGGWHVGHAAAQAAAGAGDVIVYWQPGCVYCDRLKLGLGRARHEVSWVNILRDSEAADFVASHHGGNKIVPTVFTGAGDMIDATPAAIKAQLGVASTASGQLSAGE